MAKSKVISIEIGYSLTKVCEIDYKASNPKIYHNFIMPTPEGVLKDGALEHTEEFIQMFKGRLREERIKTKQAVFSISSSKIASREVSIPLVKENRIADVVKANAKEYFPIDLSQYQFAYSILGTESDGKGNGQYRLQVLAAPNQLLLGYKAFADALSLTLVALDYNGNSLYSAIKSESGKGTQIILQIEERNTLIMVVKDNMVILNRSVAYGVDDALQVIVDSKEFGLIRTYYNALNMVSKDVCILNSLPVEDSEEEGEKLSKEQLTRIKITNSFTYLIGGIGRVLDYYNARNTASPIEKMQITGLGSGFKGLDVLLGNELSTETKMMEDLAGFQSDNMLEEGNFGEYISCLGAAIDPVDFTSGLFESKGAKKKQVKKQVKGEKKVRDYDLICKAIMIAGISIAIILILLSLVPYLINKNEHKNLTQKAETYKTAYPIYENYLSKQKTYIKLAYFDITTKNRLEDLNAFLTELERTMPTSFAVQSFTADTAGVSVNVSVDSKAAAASVISEIQAFTMVEAVEVVSILEQESEIGEMKVSFSATIVFKPVEYALPNNTEQSEEE